MATRRHGYLLRVDPGELDLDRFRQLVERGRAALAAEKPEKAAEVLREALALWRGPPLADFTYDAFAQAPVTQLEELQLSAVEERVEADLALGRHQELVSELGALVERNPLRERLRGQLMLALYRCGRQAEALEVYQEFRQALSRELGLDPGPGLRQLELAILARDPSLEPPSGNGAALGAAVDVLAPQRPALTRNRLRLAAFGLGLVALAIAGALLALTGGGARPRLSGIAADSVGAISPARGAIAAVVPVGTSPSGVAAGDRAIWVSNYNENTVSRIDLATRAVVETIPAGSTPSGIAVGAGGVWVTNNFAGRCRGSTPASTRWCRRSPLAARRAELLSVTARCGSPTQRMGPSLGSTRSQAV